MSGTEIKIKDSVGIDSAEFKKYNWYDSREMAEQIKYIPKLSEYVIITECKEGSFHKKTSIQVKREVKNLYDIKR